MNRRSSNTILEFIDSSNFNKLARLRVKIDAHGFPYVAIYNNRVNITSDVFPQWVWSYGNKIGQLTVVEGIEELTDILDNPDLTTDKLPIKALMSFTKQL